MTKTFEDLKFGDILIAKEDKTLLIKGEEDPFITKDKEYIVSDNSDGFIPYLDDSGTETVSSCRPLSIFFTIKE